MFMHPDLDSWIPLDRTGEPQKLAHGNLIPTLTHRAGISSLAAPRCCAGRSNPAEKTPEYPLGSAALALLVARVRLLGRQPRFGFPSVGTENSPRQVREQRHHDYDGDCRMRIVDDGMLHF